MAKMKSKRKYSSKATSKSSWNKRVSCRQNMRKGRIKANYKRQAMKNPNYDIYQVIWELICCIFMLLVVLWWIFSL